MQLYINKKSLLHVQILALYWETRHPTGSKPDWEILPYKVRKIPVDFIRPEFPNGTPPLRDLPLCHNPAGLENGWSSYVLWPEKPKTPKFSPASMPEHLVCAFPWCFLLSVFCFLNF